MNEIKTFKRPSKLGYLYEYAKENIEKLDKFKKKKSDLKMGKGKLRINSKRFGL
jgi:hypothetical protein